MTLTLEQKIKLIMSERKALILCGCKDEKMLYKLTGEFYQAKTKEGMSFMEYQTAVKLQYNEDKKLMYNQEKNGRK